MAMTIHFAAARPSTSAYLAGVSRRNLARSAANDNHAAQHSTRVAPDRLLREALKHFAVHGLGAAEQARREAERGYHAGELETYRYWLDICGKFDRRMAAALVRKYGA